MYFIQKQGVYGHGIFWIGEDKEKGREQLVKCVTHDSDGYHRWQLCEFKEQVDFDGDAEHVVIYELNKDKLSSNKEQ